MSTSPVASTVYYIEKTSKLIKLLRFGESYDDLTGLMVPNKYILQYLYASGYNFRTLNSFAVLNILRRYILGFENVTYDTVDIDSIKYVVMGLVS